MLSQRFATPLRLRIEHSRRLQFVAITFFLLSLLALLLLQIPLLLKLSIVLLWLSLFLFIWRRRAELGGAPVDLILRPNGAWLLERGRESIPLQLHGQSTVSRSLLLLCFKESRGRRSFDYVLWRAELSPQLFRRLRVYLRLYATETPG
ncbi:MAG: protein YgfX [Pseudomonadota bacterium]